MLIENKFFSMRICDSTGYLDSFSNKTKELVKTKSSNKSLFSLRFRSTAGKPLDLFALDAESISISCDQKDGEHFISILYKKLSGLPINTTVIISYFENEPYTYWRISLENKTEFCLEWIDFPEVIIPNDLVGAGGDSKLLWPAMEGVLIEDADIRENSGWLTYRPVGYPSKGMEGYYPGAAPVQFMACYGTGGGLYVGAHDGNSNVKAIEFYKKDTGIKLEFRLFPGVGNASEYAMDYDMVLGVFEGDWYDAASIYRDWYLQQSNCTRTNLQENTNTPAWLKEDSPVIVIYPVRGTKDTGDMTPNEYFPYSNAIPVIEGLSDAFDSKMMALLMHWEGTAPWAPPYVWPPFGGEDGFREFAEKLHEKGNLLGVYCSGIGWTNESVIWPEYNRKEQFESENLAGIMCISPEGDLPQALICNGPIRWGYDMCPSSQKVQNIVINEITNIIKSGCDYIQYFDQNLGGGSSFCYSKDHGHVPVPGKWQKDAMVGLYKKIGSIINESGREVVIGCEAGAAEPYIPYLQLNDLRFNIGYFIGKPVPLYAFIFHEFINNFMGNQCCLENAIDHNKSVDDLLYRIAYSFTAGDLISVNLKGNGEINWGWNEAWEHSGPDQVDAIALIKHLNAWRKGFGKPFLCFGKMFKPYFLQHVDHWTMHMKDGRELLFPVLLTSRWKSQDGREVQIIANYTKESQKCSICFDILSRSNVWLVRNPDGKTKELITGISNAIDMEISPLSAIMLEFVQ